VNPLRGGAAQRSPLWLGGLALLVAAMFGDVLLPGARLLGDARGDMVYHTLPWRAFGFGELAKGNLALWNPYVFGGAPYFGGSQSALLYPPNLVFLVLPLPMAVNWSVALNFWLLGAFMFLWARRRGLAPFAAFVCGALYMFCAPHFLRVQGGLVTNLAAMAWAPLVFLCIDEWLASRRPGWCLLGMVAVAMQIFAGQPQYVYYTALIAGVYGAARLLEARQGRGRAALGLLGLYAGGALLAAVQMLPALQATAETIRGQPQPYDFAASFFFPPENLITFLAPGFFGDVAHQPYWGRWFLWEACGFLGVTGLALALHGLGAQNLPARRALLAAALAAALLALGASTPLYRVLYEWLPWFGKFRAVGKFMYLSVLILILLAGYGLDRLLRERVVPARSLLAAAAVVALLLAGAAAVRAADWQAVFMSIIRTEQSYADRSVYGHAAGVLAAQAFASLSLALAGLTLAAAAGLALWARREPRAALLLGALAIAEVFAFARMQRPTIDRAAADVSQLRAVIASQPGDYRVLNQVHHNSGVFTGAPDAWGYDPLIERRYAELIHWSVGKDPGSATQLLEFRQIHPLLAMLRVKYVIEITDRQFRFTPGVMAPLHHVELVGGYQVQAGRDAVLLALGAPGFDPRKQVILEREPRPAPVAAASQGRAAVVRQGTDWLEIEAEVISPSVLLVTDAWSPAWRARALEGSSASEYEVMPANYALRAVALGAGRHRLRMEYAPAEFRIGVAVSAAAWLALVCGALVLWRRARRERHA
jgi:hypothetical protein